MPTATLESHLAERDDYASQPFTIPRVERSGLAIEIARTPHQVACAWQLVYPADGLADAPEERYEFSLPAEADLTRLIVRATDLLQNVGTGAGR